jgi:hypothetical protein
MFLGPWRGFGQALSAPMVAKHQDGAVAHEIADGPVKVIGKGSKLPMYIGQ